MDNKDLTKIFLKKVASTEEYNEALNIVKLNSKGKIWLVGGIVSRTLLQEFYGLKQPEFDFDFIAEKLNNKFTVPKQWKLSRKKYGNPTFIKGKLEVDLFPVSDHAFIKKNKLKPTIQNFFKGTPFTIQAMAFDVKRKKLLISKQGLEALNNKEYKVNNFEEAMLEAERKEITINQRITQKAKSLGLEPILLK